MRLNPFDYTEKNVTTIKKEQEAIDAEIARVKALPRNSKFWTSRPDGINELFMNDPVTKVKGVSEAKAELLGANGIMTVQDLVDLGEDRDAFNAVVKTTKGLGKVGLQNYVDACEDAKSGETPKVDYYIDDPHPYRAKYGKDKDEWGEEKWLVEMRKSAAFSGIVCITEMVKHTVLETQACFADTVNKDTYHFYHDALSQLTCDKTVSWMKDTPIPDEEKCIYDRWVKPENGLNDAFGKRWWARPVGDLPELMPLDNSLNKDIHESVRRLVVASVFVFIESFS